MKKNNNEIHWQDHLGNTNLSIAAWDGDLERIKELMSLGAEVNKPTYLGHSSLAQAAYAGRDQACGVLIDYGADPDFGREVTGETPLHCAVIKEHINVVSTLLKGGADPNKQSKHGIISQLLNCNVEVCEESPLHWAAAFGSSEMINLLLAAGANIHLKTSFGETPFQWAGRYKRGNEIWELLDNKK